MFEQAADSSEEQRFNDLITNLAVFTENGPILLPCKSEQANKSCNNTDNCESMDTIKGNHSSFVEPIPNSENCLAIDDDNIEAASNTKECRIGAKTRDKQKWTQNKNKMKRMKGDKYDGLIKENGKWSFSSHKESRALKPRCSCSISLQNKSRNCSQLTESNREALFKRFWEDMTWGERKVYINGLVQRVPVLRRRGESKRRSATLFYHFMVDGTRISVCKKMFLNTLDLGEWSVSNWVTNSEGTNKSSLRDNNIESASNTNEHRIGEKQRTKQKWTRNKNKMKRMKGDKYDGLIKENGKWRFSSQKESRALKPRCSCSIYSQNKSRNCSKITELNREELFKRFWEDMTWGERKMYVNSLVQRVPVLRRRGESKRRSATLYYHFTVDGTQLSVCKKMFLNTLGLGEWSVSNWVTSSEGTNKSSLPGVKVPDKRVTVSEFFDKLPKLESHHCTSSSSKLYLEPTWKSKASLYKQYINWCAAGNVEKASKTIFCDVFSKKNLSLFAIHEVACDVCASHKVVPVNEQEYADHITKNESKR